MEPEITAPPHPARDPLGPERARQRQDAADKRRRHTALGLCAICDTAAISGQTLCERHRELRRVATRQRYDRIRERERARRHTPEYRAQNAARRRRRVQTFREQGTCIRCGAARAASGVLCEKHRERNRARTARRKAEQRAAAEQAGAMRKTTSPDERATRGDQGR